MNDAPPIPIAAEPAIPAWMRWAVNLSPGALLGAGAPVALGAGLFVPDLGPLLLAGFLGIVGGVVSVLRPGIGLFLFTLMMYSRASEVLTTSLGVPSIAPLVTIWLLTGVIMHYGFGGLLYARPTGWQALAVYGLVLLASTLVATNPWVAMIRVVDYTREIVYIGLIITCARQLSDLRIVTRAMLAGGTIPAILTIYQTVTGSTYDFLGFARYSQAIVIPGEITEVSRPAGMVGDPNFYAMALIALIPLAFHHARWERSLLARQLSMLSALALAVASIMTYSRGGYVTLAAVVVSLIVAGFIRIRSVITVTLVFLLMLPALPDSYSGRVSSLLNVPASLMSRNSSERGAATDTSVNGRVVEAMAGVNMFLDYPILGVGTNNYPERFQEYARPLGVNRRVQRAPHNLYVEIAAETGVVGLIVFGALISTLFVSLRRVWRTTNHGNELYDLALAVAVSLIGLLVASIFLHFAYPRFLMVFFGLSIAVASVQNWRVAPAKRLHFSRLQAPQQLLTPEQHRRAVVWGGAAAVLAAVMVSAVVVAMSIDPSGGLPFQSGRAAAIQPLPGLLAVSAMPGPVPPGRDGQSAQPSLTPQAASPSVTPAAIAPTLTPGPPVDVAIQARLLRQAMRPAEPRSDCMYVQAGQHNICGDFASFYAANGGQDVFGAPLTEEYIVGGTLVQYFEFGRFEWDPRGDGAGNHVFLTRLGAQQRLASSGREVDPPALPDDGAGCVYEDATGHNVCGEIVYRWIADGGPAIFGYPITERIRVGDRQIQYFERARFEVRPSADGTTELAIAPLGAEEIARILSLSDPSAAGETGSDD